MYRYGQGVECSNLQACGGRIGRRGQVVRNDTVHPGSSELIAFSSVHLMVEFCGINRRTLRWRPSSSRRSWLSRGKFGHLTIVILRKCPDRSFSMQYKSMTGNIFISFDSLWANTKFSWGAKEEEKKEKRRKKLLNHPIQTGFIEMNRPNKMRSKIKARKILLILELLLQRLWSDDRG